MSDEAPPEPADATAPWNDPAHHESVPCLLCEAPAADALVVGTRGRFDMPVRNVACRRCGLVRVDPRPRPAAMDAYYRGPYRAQYRAVKLPAPGGGFVGPDDPGYLEARARRYRDQAAVAVRLGERPAGARVLEVGCRDGQTLAHMRDGWGMEVHGVEPGPAEAAQARERGVPVFVGLLEELRLGPGGNAPGFPEAFDQVQMFHVLEHLHDPLDALVRLGRWLRPGGRLVIEVPNVTQPYGALEGNFFQNAHLTSFSANTLSALFRRAGLAPLRLVDAGTLYLVGTPEPASAPLPRPFERAMLPAPTEDGAWIAARLDTYRHLERLRQAILRGAPTMPQLTALSEVLQRPGFPAHTAQAVDGIVARLSALGAPRAAFAVLRAAAAGPHPPPLVQRWAREAAARRAALEPTPTSVPRS
jgi:SAM-dependent methyltransferase